MQGFKAGANTLVLVRGFGSDGPVIAHHVWTTGTRACIRLWIAEARIFQPGALDVDADRLAPFRVGRSGHPAQTALDAHMVIERRIHALAGLPPPQIWC